MEFAIYRKFVEEAQASEFVTLLTQHGISYELSEDRDSLDSLYGDKQFSRRYYVKIAPSDFKKVDEILEENSVVELSTVGKDHYLFTFTDEELYEILQKRDEWNEFDFALAQQILKERGKPVGHDQLDILKSKRIEELARPEQHHRGWLVAGYVFSLMGGLLGVFIGWHLSTFKKTLPNGDRIYAFEPGDRAHGQRILILGIVMLTLSIIVAIQ